MNKSNDYKLKVVEMPHHPAECPFSTFETAKGEEPKPGEAGLFYCLSTRPQYYRKLCSLKAGCKECLALRQADLKTDILSEEICKPLF